MPILTSGFSGTYVSLVFFSSCLRNFFSLSESQL